MPTYGATASCSAQLVSALAGEGHEFTEHRFHAWFAGLATLSDEPALGKRDPRAICETILTELGHSSWHELADIAPRFKRALLAPAAPWGLGVGQALTTSTSAKLLMLRTGW